MSFTLLSENLSRTSKTIMLLRRTALSGPTLSGVLSGTGARAAETALRDLPIRFIATDPDRDTPEALGRCVQRSDPRSVRLSDDEAAVTGAAAWLGDGGPAATVPER